jgi:hypothetical protein
VVRILLWTGAIATVAGLIVLFVFLGTATTCSSDSLSEIANCQHADTGLHIGFAVLTCGAFVLFCAAVASVRRTRRSAGQVSSSP